MSPPWELANTTRAPGNLFQGGRRNFFIFLPIPAGARTRDLQTESGGYIAKATHMQGEMTSWNSLVPRPSAREYNFGRPGQTYHATDVTGRKEVDLIGAWTGSMKRPRPDIEKKAVP